MNHNARFILAVAILAVLLCSSVGLAQTWTAAPPNPEYLKYLDSLNHKGFAAMSSETLAVEGEQQYSLGLIPMEIDLSHLTPPGEAAGASSHFRLLGDPIIPAWYDLRVLNRVTPVKDQGQCGSCWAFAAYGSLESTMLPWENWDLSENDLKNHTTCCGGGNHGIATSYLARWSGAVSEADHPYYQYNCSTSPPNAPVSRRIQDVYYLPGRYNASSDDYIKEAVMKYGAVYTSMCYDFGPYFNDATDAYYSNGGMPNHAVCIVGWDDHFSRNNFLATHRPPGDGAFIIKNSWNQYYGEGGYFYISYYEYNLGQDLVVFKAEETPTFQEMYQYDRNGWSTSLSNGSTTAWFANIFTAASTEKIGAVSFYAAQSDTAYELYVYIAPDNGPINSGGPVYSQSGTLTYAGYRTIRLNQPVQVTSGQRFSIVMKITTGSYTYIVPIEGGQANAGEGFISANGTAWTDLTSTNPGYSVCLKAFTVQASGLSVTPEDATNAYGPVGGSFEPSQISFTVTNTSGQSVNWSASDTANWLDLQPASGSLAAGAFTTVNATINSSANSLAAGLYTDDITFSVGGAPVAMRHVGLKVGRDLFVKPTAELDISGPTGGPFAPVSTPYVMLNYGAFANWTASKTQNWLTVSPTSGTIDAVGYETVNISVNSNASSLAPGTYTDYVTFSVGGTTQVRRVDLIVKAGSIQVTSDPVLRFGGPAGGPFSPPSNVCTLSNDGAIIQWQAASNRNWVTISPSSGTLGFGEQVDVSVSVNSNANGLAQGPYTGSVTFTNITNHAGDTSRPVSLGVGPIRVKPTGSDANNGSSWSLAKQTIQAAVDAAMPGQEIWVAAGDYYASLYMRNNISLYGGFAGTETSRTQRDPSLNATTITAQSAHAVTWTGISSPETTIDGFRIYNSGEQGIYCSSSSGTISNNVIYENWRGGILCDDQSAMVITGNTISGNGGCGIRASQVASVTITNNTVTSNIEWDSYWAGGISIYGTEATVTGNVITNNNAYMGGPGGVYFCPMEGTLSDNTITGNSGGAGAGMYLAAGPDVTVCRNIITDNTGSPGAGIYAEMCHAVIDSNIIARNAGGGIYGVDTVMGPIINNTIVDNMGMGGIYLESAGTVPVANNIIAFNAIGVFAGAFGDTPAEILLSHNDVYGSTVANYSQIAPGVGDISADPAFVNRAGQDLHLTLASPCVDAGDSAASGIGEFDIDHNARVIGEVDMGADECLKLPIRVSPTGNDANDGLTWPAAKRTVQGAIDAAMPGQEIWVAAGNYEQCLTMKNNVSLYGGFAGTETSRDQRDPSQNATTLTAMGSHAISMTGISSPETTIDGFRIWNASDGGIYCSASSATISNNLIDDNNNGGIFCENDSALVITGNTITANAGCGIRSSYSSATVTDNTISGNCEWGYYGAGGIAIAGGTASVTGNTISGNYAWGYGVGGVFFGPSAEGTLSNNTISGNTGYNGGGMGLCAGPEATVSYNTITDNTGTMGGGIFVENSYAPIINNIIARNTGGGIYGYDTVMSSIVNNTICDNTGQGGIYLESCGMPTIANNIIAGNAVGVYAGAFGECPAEPLLANNDVYGNTTNYDSITPGTNDISANPQFVNRSGGDYHLLSLSPCIDTGLAQSTASADMDGNTRPIDGDGNGSAGWDIGAYEYVPGFAIIRRAAPNGTQVTLSNMSVTACFLNADPSGENWVYVENTDRTAGIRVKTPAGFSTGELVNVSGTLQTDTVNGERYIDADPDNPQQAGGTLGIATLGMRNEWIGGAASGPIPILKDGFGFYNVGTLVQTWGNVGYVNATQRYIYVNDGSHLYDGSGFYGLRVPIPAGVPMPTPGQFVKVTGISSATKIGANYVRTIRPRNGADIQTPTNWYFDPIDLSIGCWNMLSIPGIPQYSGVENVFQAAGGEPSIVLDGYLKNYNALGQAWIYYQSCSSIMNALVAEGYGLYIPPGGAGAYDYYRTPVTGDQLISLPRGSNPAGFFSFVGNPFDYGRQWSSIKVTDGSSIISLPEAVSIGWIHRIDRWTGATWAPITDLSTSTMAKRTGYCIYPKVNNLALIVPAQ